MADRVAIALLFLLLAGPFIASAFQSDELQEDDEEWGITGSPSPKIEQVIRTPSSPRPPPLRRSSAGDGLSADAKTVQFELEHSIGGADFTSAGVFSARLRNLHHGGQSLTKLRLARRALTTEEQEAFKGVLREDGFYTIRLPANVLTASEDSIISSIKARCLAASNMQEKFDIYMDGGNVIAIGYEAGDCVYPQPLKYPTKWDFDSHIVLKSGEQAVRMVTVIDDAGVELGDDGQPKKPPEKSFWAKYWMYIVPLGLIVLNAITQVANMPDEASGQGTAQAGAQRALNNGPRRR